ncbi:MAG: hypothetical protein NTW03_19580, partial [Verrucomicrobia bacterium]|nr:hypothetical protein [Verrucomicrobiota bacterium]
MFAEELKRTEQQEWQQGADQGLANAEGVEQFFPRHVGDDVEAFFRRVNAMNPVQGFDGGVHDQGVEEKHAHGIEAAEFNRMAPDPGQDHVIE